MEILKEKDLLLLSNIEANLPELQKIQTDFNKFYLEDVVYRFYHQSFKVYYGQDQIRKAVKLFEKLSPETGINPWFLEIVADATKEGFDHSHNRNWLKHTRPIVECFLHCSFFINTLVDVHHKHRQNKLCKGFLDTDYAAVAYLFNIR